jgi:hypothetical protein
LSAPGDRPEQGGIAARSENGRSAGDRPDHAIQHDGPAAPWPPAPTRAAARRQCLRGRLHVGPVRADRREQRHAGWRKATGRHAIPRRPGDRHAARARGLQEVAKRLHRSRERSAVRPPRPHEPLERRTNAPHRLPKWQRWVRSVSRGRSPEPVRRAAVASFGNARPAHCNPDCSKSLWRTATRRMIVPGHPGRSGFWSEGGPLSRLRDHRHPGRRSFRSNRNDGARSRIWVRFAPALQQPQLLFSKELALAPGHPMIGAWGWPWSRGPAHGHPARPGAAVASFGNARPTHCNSDCLKSLWRSLALRIIVPGHPGRSGFWSGGPGGGGLDGPALHVAPTGQPRAKGGRPLSRIAV